MADDFNYEIDIYDDENDTRAPQQSRPAGSGNDSDVEIAGSFADGTLPPNLNQHRKNTLLLPTKTNKTFYQKMRTLKDSDIQMANGMPRFHILNLIIDQSTPMQHQRCRSLILIGGRRRKMYVDGPRLPMSSMS